MLYTTVQMFGVGKIFWKTSLMLIKAYVSYAHSFISPKFSQNGNIGKYYYLIKKLFK